MTDSRRCFAPGLPATPPACPPHADRTAHLVYAFAALLAFVLPAGCEKTGGDASSAVSPSPTTTTAPHDDAAPSAPASGTPAATSTPAATTAPLASPASATTPATPGTAAPSPGTGASAAKSPQAGSTTAVPRPDQAEITRISAAAGLPVPPDLSKYPADLAAHLDKLVRAAAANPTAETIGTLGCLYHAIMGSREESERAQLCYEKAKGMDPKSYVWPHLLGRMFLRRQSDVRARMEFNASIALNPDYLDNLAWLADVELQANAPEEARKYYMQLIEKKPDEPYSHAGLAEVELKLGNLEAAKGHLDRAMALDARNRRVHNAMADYYEKNGATELAERHRAFASQLPPALVSQDDPVNLRLIRACGPTVVGVGRVRMLAEGGDSKHADQARDVLLAEYPNSAVLLTGAAEVSLMLQRPKEAIEFFKKALAADPAYPRALVGMADGLAALNRLDEALAQADSAIALDPGLSAAYVARGRALQMLGRGDEAVAAFKTALESQPGNIVLRTTVGELLLAQGKLPEAKEWCTQIVRSAEASGKVPPEVAPAYVALGSIAEQEGNAEAAARNYFTALKSDPTLEPVFRRFAHLFIQLGRGDDALKLGKELCEANPQVLDYAITYGNLLSTVGKTAEAIEYFEKMSSEMPNHPAPHYALATIYREKDEVEKTRQCLNEVIRLQPTHEGAWLLLFENARIGGNSSAASDVLRAALEKLPDSIALNNSLAWTLATSPDAALREPKRAVEIAEKVVAKTQRRAANLLDTLACAYAADGRLDDAVRVAKEAVAVAEASNQPDLAQEFKERAAVFESGQAFVDKQ